MTAYGYTRLSQQSDTSIQDQKQYIRQYCSENNLELEKIFNEGEKSSGFKNDREKYQEMLQKIREKDVQAIVVRDRTRFGRDKLERMQRFIELYRRGVEIHIQAEDSTVDFDGDFELVKESFHAEKDDVAKREEIKKAKEALEKRDERDCYQGRPPYGLKFDEDKCHLIPDENFGDCMKAIEMREDGETLESIAEELKLTNAAKVHRIMKRKKLYCDKAEEVDSQWEI